MEQELIRIGFTPHEAAIYLALVDIGMTGTAEIIRRTSLHRNIVYTTLDKLIAKQLVFKVIENKKAQFQVTDPGRILAEIQDNLLIAQKIVPDLATRASVKQEVTMYHGVNGFRDYTIRTLQRLSKNETIYILGSIGDEWYELMGDRLTEHEKIMANKQIHWKLIGYEASRRDQAHIEKLPKLIQSKVIPKSYKTPANVNIWQDTIALQIFTEPVSVIEIKNAALAESYMNYFDLLWNMKV